MRSPEGHEKDATKKFLKTIPCCWFFNPYMAGMGASGVPDIVGCVDGCLFSVEVKREGKEPTPIQWKRMREIEAAGGKCFWGVAEKVIGEMKVWLGTVQ